MTNRARMAFERGMRREMKNAPEQNPIVRVIQTVYVESSITGRLIDLKGVAVPIIPGSRPKKLEPLVITHGGNGESHRS